MLDDRPCLCGSGQTLARCCGELLAGKPAHGPEALMRSRYSAYALGKTDYLRQTWAPETCPSVLEADPGIRWTGLQVIRARTSGSDGLVEFRATFQAQGQWQQLHETSRFRKADAHWLYVDGDARWLPLKPGRNSPCPCGSGRKYKQCCGA